MAKDPRQLWQTFDARDLARYRQVGLIILLGIGLAFAFWPRPGLAELISRGEVSLEKNDYQGAYQNFRRALVFDPSSYPAHLGLSKVYENIGDYDLALSELKIAAQLNQSVDLGDEVIRLKTLRDDPKTLKEELAKTVSILLDHPTFRNAWTKAAYLHYRLRDDEAAKKALERALEIDPNYEPALRLRALLP